MSKLIVMEGMKVKQEGWFNKRYTIEICDNDITLYTIRIHNDHIGVHRWVVLTYDKNERQCDYGYYSSLEKAVHSVRVKLEELILKKEKEMVALNEKRKEVAKEALIKEAKVKVAKPTLTAPFRTTGITQTSRDAKGNKIITSVYRNKDTKKFVGAIFLNGKLIAKTKDGFDLIDHAAFWCAKKVHRMVAKPPAADIKVGVKVKLLCGGAKMMVVRTGTLTNGVKNLLCSWHVNGIAQERWYPVHAVSIVGE